MPLITADESDANSVQMNGGAALELGYDDVDEDESDSEIVERTKTKAGEKCVLTKPISGKRKRASQDDDSDDESENEDEAKEDGDQSVENDAEEEAEIKLNDDEMTPDKLKEM